MPTRSTSAAEQPRGPVSGVSVAAFASIIFLIVLAGCATPVENHGIEDAAVDTAKGHYQRGRTLADHERWKEAVAEFNVAIQQDSSYIDAYYFRGCVKFDTEDYPGAIADLDRALYYNSEFGDAYFARGNAKAAQGDLRGSIVDYNDALKRGYRKAITYVNRGDALRLTGNVDAAVRDYKAALLVEPGLPLAVSALRDAQSGDLKIKFHSIIDRSINAFARGNNQLQENRTDESIASFTEALRINPANAFAYSGLGFAYFRKENLKKSLENFNRAIQLDCADVTVYSGRGILYRRMGKREKALSDFDEIIRRVPSLAIGYLRRAELSQAGGDPESAVRDFTEALKLSPNDSSVCNDLAWLLATSSNASVRNASRAKELAQKACAQRRWKDPACLDTFAAACAAAGDFEAAVKLEEQVLNLASGRQYLKGTRERLSLYRQGKPYREP